MENLEEHRMTQSEDNVIIAVVLVGVVIIGAVGYCSLGAFIGWRYSYEVEITATNNGQVHLMDKRTAIPSGNPYFKYYDLPYVETEVYGDYANLQYWFLECYKVNDTFQEFLHGPFSFVFDDEATEPITYELNQNNVTARIKNLREVS
jgi:hypothetical protein